MPSLFGPVLSPSDIILDGLAAGQDVISSVIDNTTTKYDSVQITIQLSTTTVRQGAFFFVGVLSSTDGVNFTDFPQTEQGIIKLVANSTKKYAVVLDQLPMYFKFYLQNRTGGALSSTTGSNTFNYLGVKN